MSKLKLEDIRHELQIHGWKLLSPTYVNLTTEMEYNCPKGHLVIKPYKAIRDKFKCPICDESNDSTLSTSIPPKPQGSYRILAIDQATQTSGFAVFDNGKLTAFGTLSPRKDYPQVQRISMMRQWLVATIETAKPDIVLLEDIQLQGFKGDDYNAEGLAINTFKTLAEVLGVLKNVAYERKTEFVVVYAATWRNGVGVKGRTRVDKKRSAQMIVKEQFDIQVTQDEADAICLGLYGTQQFYKQMQMIDWE